MKIFLTAQKNMIYGGLIRNERAFNEVQLWTIFSFIASFISEFVYLIHVANTPRQSMDSIFMTTVGCLITISYISIAHRTTELIDFIDAFEQIINDSESRK